VISQSDSRLLLEPTALAVRAIGDWLRDATAELDRATADALLMRAELATHEACMNVVDHAGLPDGSTIELLAALNDDRLTVTVRDAGQPFDLAHVSVPDPQVLQERGYGVKIIRSLVNNLAYRRVGLTNELVLQFDIEDIHE
jgi:serine/threonine-protein kinase RsbW